MTAAGSAPFTLIAVVQAGRLQYEAVLLAASLRASYPGFRNRVVFAEPRAEGAWQGHAPGIDSAAVRAALDRLEIEVVPFTATDFGAAYPYGNKIEALHLLAPGTPFLFLDTDTLVTGPLSSLPVATSAPTASMRRTDTWPRETPGGPDRATIWRSLYTRFGLDFSTSLDPAHPADSWEHYLYFSAGWFCGPDAGAFHDRFRAYATAIRDDPPAALAGQTLHPWLDQVALPLVVHALGGGRPGPAFAGLDGAATCHFRTLPLLFARDADTVVDTLTEVIRPDWIVRALREYPPFDEILYRGTGARIRAMFDRENLPHPEDALRKALRAKGLWLR